MDLTAFTTDQTNLFSLLNLLLPLLLLFLRHVSFSSSYKKPLPPGPKPWPILGNIPHMTKNPHLSLAKLAHIHGPLISLKLGSQLLVVGSSPRAASQILKTHDRLLSARYVPKGIPSDRRVLDRISIIWASECNDSWKSLRALYRTVLFSAKAIESQASLREHKVAQMAELLRSKRGEAVNIGEVVFTTVFNILSNLMVSKDFLSLEDKEIGGRLKKVVWRMMELGATPNIADFYPVFERFDPQGLKRKLGDCIQEMFHVWEHDIKERRERHVPGAPIRDFLDVFLSNGFDDDQINWLFIELFNAATDTSVTTIEWAMSELLRNKQIMKRMKEELEREINQNPLTESHLSQLPYLNACVKETLRLHPPAPFLLPHRAPETCEVLDYTILKDSEVFVNVWAIGRDPEVWEDPLLFKPERFIGSNMDYKGHDFEFIPLSAGRRMCPGMLMAVKQVQLMVATLVRWFDWCLPNCEDLAKLDMNEKFGLTLQRQQPLVLVPNLGD